MKTPQVIHVIQSLGSGGAERVVFDLVSHLPDAGYEAMALTVCGGGPFEQLFAEDHVPLYPVTRRPPFAWSTFRELVRIFETLRPQIVHTHLFTADLMGRVAAAWSRVPCIVSTEHNVNPTYGRTKRLINRELAHVTDAHIAVSEEVKRVMVERDKIASSRIHVIQNGIDVRHRPRRGSGAFHDIPRLITVGRLEEQKDHATLLEALAPIRAPWRLSVVGQGGLERSLRSQAEHLGIAARIEWLGFRDDVADLLAASDIFCFPSRYEGLGLAAMEAAVSGVPVIASDIAPLRELFRPQDVHFVPPGDVSAWTDAICSVLEAPAEALRVAERLRPRIQEEGSVDLMVRKYADVYDELLAHRSSL